MVLFSRPMALLSLLTILAGIIRFTRLDHPSLWYDESMVFRRTCGTYGQLLDCLRTDGFVPLHYSLVWVISRFFKPTPIVLRFFPALCGTLMTPAVYFLARQLLNRSTSLLAAAFTACSAFMLFYSRDAKMYMDAWLFVTLNSACLLWWFRTKKSTAWLCWIASGGAACGIHFSSIIPVAISLLLLLTQSRMRWQDALLWLAGVDVILSGPLLYYEKFNTWKERIDDDGWRDSGLVWINIYNYGRTGPQLLRFLGSSMLTGWEWPKDADLNLIPPQRVIWPERAVELLLVIFLAACLPWADIWRPLKVWMPRLADPDFQSASELSSDPQPQWRIVLWLSLWIAVPLYGFYCRSMNGFASPLDWWHWLVEKFPALLLPAHHHWLLILIALLPLTLAALTIRYRHIRPMMIRGLALLVVTAGLVGICWVMAMVMASMADAAVEAGKPWASLWVPRYVGFIWPMLAVAVAALVMRLPTIAFRTAVIVFLLGLNLGIGSFRIFGQTEPPVDRMAADAFDAENPANHTFLWTHLKRGNDYPGGANLYSEPAEYYLELLQSKPTDPVLFMTALRNRQSKNPGLRSMPWDRDLPSAANTIIIWSQYDPTGPTADLAPPSGWTLQSDTWYQARDYWIWRDLDRYRRQVYVRERS